MEAAKAEARARRKAEKLAAKKVQNQQQRQRIGGAAAAEAAQARGDALATHRPVCDDDAMSDGRGADAINTNSGEALKRKRRHVGEEREIKKHEHHRHHHDSRNKRHKKIDVKRSDGDDGGNGGDGDDDDERHNRSHRHQRRHHKRHRQKDEDALPSHNHQASAARDEGGAAQLHRRVSDRAMSMGGEPLQLQDLVDNKEISTPTPPGHHHHQNHHRRHEHYRVVDSTSTRCAREYVAERVDNRAKMDATEERERRIRSESNRLDAENADADVKDGLGGATSSTWSKIGFASAMCRSYGNLVGLLDDAYGSFIGDEGGGGGGGCLA